MKNRKVDGKKIRKLLVAVTLGTMICVSSVNSFGETEDGRKEIKGIGISYVQTEEMKEAGLRTGYMNYSDIDQLGLFNIRTDQADLYYILVYPEEIYQAETEEERWVSRFIEAYPELEYKEEENGSYHYTYLDLSHTVSQDEMDSMQKEDLEKAISLCEELITSVEYVDLEIPGLTFDSVNLDGEQMTDAIFGEKKITVLNVWATYCNPCINEMPELAKWETEMPEDAQILYLCSDIQSQDSENIELAETIVEKSGINRKNVILMLPGTCLDAMQKVTGVPTTFFIDQNGVLLEDMVVGANVPAYKEILEKLLNERMEKE